MPEDPSRFDPRFDPAFQPGFDGGSSDADAAGTSPARRQPARPEPMSPPAGASAYRQPESQPQVRRSAAPEVAVSPTLPPQTPARPRVSQPGIVRADGDPTVETDQDAGLRRPFLIALGVVGALLIAAGLVIAAQLPALFTDMSPATRIDITTLQVLVNLAPLLIALGVATLVGLLFALALTRR